MHVRGGPWALDWSGSTVFSLLRRKVLEVVVFLLTGVTAAIALVLVMGEWGGEWGDGGRV